MPLAPTDSAVLDRLAATYVLPLRSDAPVGDDLAPYLARLSYLIDDLIMVDGSPEAVFAVHAEAFGRFGRHLQPETVTPMGKVGNVLTGLQHARHERVVIADDDVRYTPEALREVLGRLAGAHVVRPQNVFRPLPWHARWDTGRQLLNRMLGGDWPGTLAVRRSALPHGYRGDVMFENLELVRTVLAGGGREHVAYDVFVERRPPTAHHFWSQRVRQAYDEWARPERLVVQLAVLPAVAALAARGRWRMLGAGVAGIAALAEAGRRRGGGRRVYGPTAPLWAPLWTAERAVTSWLAVGERLLRGGVAYRGGRLARAATPLRTLRRLHGARPAPEAGPRHAG